MLSSVAPLTTHYFMPEGWLRFVITSTVAVISCSIVILFVGCNQSERMFVFSKIPFIKH